MKKIVIIYNFINKARSVMVFFFIKILVTITFMGKIQKKTIINIGSEMNFQFHTVFMKRVVCFISPSLWRGDIKHTTSFINTV